MHVYVSRLARKNLPTVVLSYENDSRRNWRKHDGSLTHWKKELTRLIGYCWGRINILSLSAHLTLVEKAPLLLFRAFRNNANCLAAVKNGSEEYVRSCTCWRVPAKVILCDVVRCTVKNVKKNYDAWCWEMQQNRFLQGLMRPLMRQFWFCEYELLTRIILARVSILHTKTFVEHFISDGNGNVIHLKSWETDLRL